MASYLIYDNASSKILGIINAMTGKSALKKLQPGLIATDTQYEKRNGNWICKNNKDWRRIEAIPARGTKYFSYVISDIVWCTGDNVEDGDMEHTPYFPEEVCFDSETPPEVLEKDSDSVTEWLTDTYGFLVEGYAITCEHYYKNGIKVERNIENEQKEHQAVCK